MEAKGESMAAAFLESDTGASIETGGAHWFAAPASVADEAHTDQKSIDGKLLIEARSLKLSTGL